MQRSTVYLHLDSTFLYTICFWDPGMWILVRIKSHYSSSWKTMRGTIREKVNSERAEWKSPEWGHQVKEITMKYSMQVFCCCCKLNFTYVRLTEFISKSSVYWPCCSTGCRQLSWKTLHLKEPCWKPRFQPCTVPPVPLREQTCPLYNQCGCMLLSWNLKSWKNI